MVLAHGTPHPLLDEPTTYLDLAAQHADHLVVMDCGTVAAEGAPAEVLSEELLAMVFGLRATVVDVGGAPVAVPDRVRV
jgi:iron complex transport system ATP-binding protein